MKKNTYLNLLRNITTACLALVMFIASSTIVLASEDKKSLMGQLTVSGKGANGDGPSVLLNGERAFTGRTFFSSGSFVTSEDTTATVKLGKAGYISLAPNSTLSLNFDEKVISGVLSAGQIKVFNAEGVEVKIQTPEGVLSNKSNDSTNFTVDVQAGAMKATVESGSVVLNNGTSVVPVGGAQTTDDDGNSPVGPLLVYIGIVAAAVILVVLHNRDDDDNRPIISPVR